MIKRHLLEVVVQSAEAAHVAEAIGAEPREKAHRPKRTLPLAYSMILMVPDWDWLGSFSRQDENRNLCFRSGCRTCRQMEIDE